MAENVDNDKGFSNAPTSPGYPLDKSLKDCNTTDLKRGYKKGS